MGYLSTLYNELNFSRPLTPKETKAIDYEQSWDIRLIMDEDVFETSEVGPVTAEFACGIEPGAEGESIKAYYVEEKIQQIVDQLPEDVEVTGYIRWEGEEVGDIGRWVVRDRKVVAESPQIIWPDGTVEGGRN